jgi:hypothetical protein
MTEKLLQFIWQFQYYNKNDLTAVSGEVLQILKVGNLNTNQGPDFLEAKIKCGETTLVGNIEVHIKSSDWNLHNHTADKNYGNIILHVVWENDAALNLPFPVLELNQRISQVLLSKFKMLMQSKTFIPCQSMIHTASDITLIAWKERVVIERLQEKASYIKILLAQNNNHWEEVFWQMLAKNFGIKLNANAFESMAKNIPLQILAKHKNQLLQLEALLMGVVGLLDKNFTTDYPLMLQKEYKFLSKKYNLQQAVFPVYFLRMRPANFPTIRLSQLAQIIFTSSHLFSKIKNASSMTEVYKMFDVTANDYWHYHYTFENETGFKQKPLGKQMIGNIIINTVLPILYAYGWYNNDEVFQNKAINWALALPAEKNNITKGFEDLGMQNKNAHDSQAYIQLYNNYCSKKKCLQCAIGNKILKT